jgi:hypothetical protein
MSEKYKLGYYWVKPDTDAIWEPAWWYPIGKCWLLLGYTDVRQTSEIFEIGDQIEVPEKYRD